ncbi:MAG: hypothetical protein WCI22_06580 [Actinomycetota bacterium]
MTRDTKRPHHDDRGASLVFAIAFIVFIGTVSSGMASMITSSVGDRVQLQKLRDKQYAADGAVEKEIVRIRQVTDQSIVDTCGTTSTMNANTIRVDCTQRLDLVTTGFVIYTQRNVVFKACPSTGVACTDAKVIIFAEVNFQQLRNLAPVTKTLVMAWRVTP